MHGGPWYQRAPHQAWRAHTQWFHECGVRGRGDLCADVGVVSSGDSVTLDGQESRPAFDSPLPDVPPFPFLNSAGSTVPRAPIELEDLHTVGWQDVKRLSRSERCVALSHWHASLFGWPRRYAGLLQPLRRHWILSSAFSGLWTAEVAAALERAMGYGSHTAGPCWDRDPLCGRLIGALVGEDRVRADLLDLLPSTFLEWSAFARRPFGDLRARLAETVLSVTYVDGGVSPFGRGFLFGSSLRRTAVR